MSSRQTARRSYDPAIIHAIAELTLDACLVMDTDAVILEANGEAARLYGYRAQDFVGMHVSRLCAVLDTVIVHDLKGELLLANGAAAARAGMTHEEFMRLGPWGWVAEEARGTVAERLALIVDEGSRVELAGTSSPEGGSLFLRSECPLLPSSAQPRYPGSSSCRRRLCDDKRIRAAWQ